MRIIMSLVRGGACVLAACLLGALTPACTPGQSETGGSETLGEDQCSQYIGDIGGATEVTVTVRNDGAAPIFVAPPPSCNEHPPFTMTEMGQPVQFYIDACDFSCEEVLDAGDCACTLGCAQLPVLRIDPGGARSYAWAGRVFTDVELPAECQSEACPGECKQAFDVNSGTYALEVSGALTLAACVDDPTACECTPNEEGWCEIFLEGAAEGDPSIAAAELVLPDMTSVDLVFN